MILTTRRKRAAVQTLIRAGHNYLVELRVLTNPDIVSNSEARKLYQAESNRIQAALDVLDPKDSVGVDPALDFDVLLTNEGQIRM